MNDAQYEKKIVLWTILTLSIAGFVDAAFLAMKKLVGSPIVCSGANGCGIVDASVYSSIGGVPLALFGTIFYAITILLLVQYLLRRQEKVFKALVAVLLIGGVASIGLIALQAFVIKAWCYYCIVSDAIGIVNALLILYLIKKKK